MTRPLVLLAGLALAACVPEAPPPEAPVPGVGAEIQIGADGRCFGRDVTPAVFQSVSAQEVDQPELRDIDGNVVAPATYRTVVRQQLVRDRQVILFETLCPPAYTAEFVESLQRALAARGFFQGTVTGHLDQATNRAIQDFQRDFGADSPLLSVIAARRLGLIALSEEQIDQLSGGANGNGRPAAPVRVP